MKKIGTVLILIIGCISMVYSQYYYLPDNSSTLLLISKKGDYKIAVAAPIEHPVNIQFGCSPINKLSLSLSYFSHDSSKEGITASTKGNSLTAAIGAYFFYPKVGFSKNKEKVSTGFLVDIYGGFTRSNISNVYASATSSHLDYQKLFIQLGVHFKSNWISLSYAMKASTLDYQEGTVNGQPSNFEILPITEEILLNEPYVLLETDIRLHVGPEYLRGFFGASMMNPNILKKIIVSDRNITFSLGLTFGINDFFKSKKRK